MVVRFGAASPARYDGSSGAGNGWMALLVRGHGGMSRGTRA